MDKVTTKTLAGKLILAATILASGMAFLDGSVVNIAIPTIQAKLNATITDIQWIVNGYTLMLCALILISGALGDRFGRKNVVSFIETNERIYPVGRLDKDTSGLLLLTNDGELTDHLIHPRYHVDKIYCLRIRGQANDAQLKALRNGVLLEDGITSPAKVSVLKISGTASELEMIIHEGRNRQIRRMCETVGITLLELQRIKFGPISLGKIKEGEYRILTENEIRLLKK